MLCLEMDLCKKSLVVPRAAQDLSLLRVPSLIRVCDQDLLSP